MASCPVPHRSDVSHTHRNLYVLTLQLQQQIEEWSKSHAELTEQIKSFERSQKDLEVALTHKDDNINVSLSL